MIKFDSLSNGRNSQVLRPHNGQTSLTRAVRLSKRVSVNESNKMIRRQKSKKKELLSDKISSLFTVAPSADVEDDQVFGTKPKTVTRDELDSDDNCEETAISDFRKQNVALLSELSSKYAGEVSTRHDSESDEESDNVTNDEESENAGSNVESDAEKSDDESIEYQHEDSDHEGSTKVKDSDEEGSSEAEESEEGFDLSQLDDDRQDTFTHIKETDQSDEVTKGKCVKNQLTVWENALEMRISLQKCLVAANKMPLLDTYKELKKDDKFNVSISKAKGNLTELLSRLLDLQTNLLGQYPETKNLLNKSNLSKKNVNTCDGDDDNEEIPSDSDSAPSEKDVPLQKKSRKRKFNDFSIDLADRHVTYSKYRNSVVQKWHDKTRLTTTHQKSAQPVSSTVSQIEFLLGDMNKLIRRTQLKRSKYDMVGQNSEEADDEVVEGDEPPKDPENVDVYCTEIFDDDDFYHQLLRELIEHKSADMSDPVQLSRQWITLQQLRSKMKRKIDTRATKGRRIRYAVHSKLVNFMAPQKSTDWTEESKKELFASLFGKNYESVADVGKTNGNSNGDLGMTIM